jgi:hypothetical protein
MAAIEGRQQDHNDNRKRQRAIRRRITALAHF